MSTACRAGVLAFGDSITNGGGELQWGVALQSWALWLARALGLPYTGYAQDGATVEDVVESQIDTHRRVVPEARYDLGCLYIGTNDVRSIDWEPGLFASRFATAAGYIADRCDRTLVVTIPLDLGRPRAGAKVEEANRIIEAQRGEAAVLDLRAFRGRRLLMADHVHPTAFGQIEIARAALAVLAQVGLDAHVDPRELVSYETTWWGRLRGDLTFTYRHAKVSTRSAAILALVRLGFM